jgi:hypothetical protein
MWHSKKSGIQNFNLSRKLEFVTPHSEGLPIFKFAKPGGWYSTKLSQDFLAITFWVWVSCDKKF